MDAGEVLREHDAALQLGRARVGGAAEIDGRAAAPEGLPLLAATGLDGFKGEGRRGFARREFAA